VNFTFQNHLLNARNPFAGNRPDYLQRDFDLGFNGPIIPERLTLNVSAGHNHQENVDTISAVTPTGLVSEGITRPSIRRSLGLNGQAYLSERQALHFSAFHNVNRQENQGIGGDTSAILADHRTHELIRKEIEGCSRDFKGFESVVNFVLSPEELTTANGMLTPTLKLKRRNVLAKYEPQLKALYA